MSCTKEFNPDKFWSKYKLNLKNVSMNLIFLKRLVIYFAITLFVILLYVHISRLWVAIGGGVLPFYKGDGPLVFLILAIFYFDKIKNKVFRHLLPTAPIIIVYFSVDIFYSYLVRSPAPSDLQNFPLVFKFSPILGFGGLLIILCTLLPIVFLVYLATKDYSIKNFITLVSFKILALVLIGSFLSSDTFSHYQRKIFNRSLLWSDGRSIQYNGRINNFIYSYFNEKENKSILLSHKSSNVNISAALYPGKPALLPNIHLIVLESFMDPRMLKDVQFNRSPLANSLQQYIRDQGFSFVISPVIGGTTSQATFELLTGIKAYAKTNATEFNVMKGGEINGFVKNLKDNGYEVLALSASGPEYFNKKLAYRSLGIVGAHFLEDSGLKKYGDRHIFDGDLFDYNIKIIMDMMKYSSKPIFNYVLGVYGHMPFARNIDIRPDVIQTTSNDKRIHRISNQFYYRTKALAKYIKTLIEIDPSSIIYITSDHLPGILGNNIQYIKDKNVNISLLFNAGEHVNVSGRYYYEIPWLIWDILTEEENDRTLMVNMEDLYYKALAESLKQYNN